MKLHITLAGSLIGLGLLVASSQAEVMRSETTETTTYSGTVSEITPSSRIVIKQDGSPVSYTINKKTTFVDEQGNVVSVNEVRGRPVKIYVTERAETPTVVERVVVSRPSTTTHVIEKEAPPAVIQQRTETRTRTEVED